MGRPRTFDEQQVLAKARDRFWKHGYAATSVQDLEAATGLKRSSLYQAFGDKRKLYDRTLAMYQGDNLAYLRDLVASVQDFATAIDRLFSDAVDRLCACPDKKGCFITNATGELASVDVGIRGFVIENRGRFTAALLPLAQRDTSLAGSAQAVCDYVFTLYSGLNLLAKSGAGRAELQDAVKIGLAGLKTG